MSLPSTCGWGLEIEFWSGFGLISENDRSWSSSKDRRSPVRSAARPVAVIDGESKVQTASCLFVVGVFARFRGRSKTRTSSCPSIAWRTTVPPRTPSGRNCDRSSSCYAAAGCTAVCAAAHGALQYDGVSREFRISCMPPDRWLQRCLSADGFAWRCAH